MQKVLYVEDNEINQIVVRGFLKGHFELSLADDPETACEMAKAVNYDVILMDINLGPAELSGIDLLKEMRVLLGTSCPPIVAVSAFTDEEDRVAILKEGFDGFHPKPINRHGLIEQIKSLAPTSH